MNFSTLEFDYNYFGQVPHTTGRQGQSLMGVTIHHMAGNLTDQQCINTWVANNTSAHYAVSGTHVAQFVDDADTSYACGNWDANCRTISIEHANDHIGNPWTVSTATLDTGAHLTAAILHHYGLGAPEWLVNVFPHSHWSATACPGELAGSQRDAFMSAAQNYYAQMCGGDAPSSKPTGYSLAVDGVQGYYTNLALQEFLRTQYNRSGELCYGTGYALDGVFGSGTVLAWQEFLRSKGFYGSGLAMDGDFGYYTKLAAQEWLRTEKNLDGELCYGKGYALDGVWGYGSVKALQEFLRAAGFYN